MTSPRSGHGGALTGGDRRGEVATPPPEIPPLDFGRIALAVAAVALTVAALRPFAAGAEPARPIVDAELARQLEVFCDQLAAADQFSGVVLVARDGTPILQKAYGLACRGYAVPNRIDTKFNLGSMNKMFTAVAIGQLLDQGRLALDDVVGKQLPDYPNKDVAAKVTLHQLLTHTSGLGDYFNDKFTESNRNRYRAVKDYFPLFASEPPAFEPGQRFRYSNAGFIVLGAVIEHVSGQDYFNYVRDHVCTPAGITDTDCFEMDRDTPNTALGYTRMGPEGVAGPLRTNVFLHVFRGGPAGGGFSTAPDLLRFDRALRGHKLLKPETTALFLEGKVAIGPGGKYAYGFQDLTHNGHRVVGHGGGFAGLSDQFDMYMDLGYTVIVLGNTDPPAAGRVAAKARELIAGAAAK